MLPTSDDPVGVPQLLLRKGRDIPSGFLEFAVNTGGMIVFVCLFGTHPNPTPP